MILCRNFTRAFRVRLGQSQGAYRNLLLVMKTLVSASRLSCKQLSRKGISCSDFDQILLLLEKFWEDTVRSLIMNCLIVIVISVAVYVMIIWLSVLNLHSSDTSHYRFTFSTWYIKCFENNNLLKYLNSPCWKVDYVFLYAFVFTMHLIQNHLSFYACL